MWCLGSARAAAASSQEEAKGRKAGGRSQAGTGHRRIVGRGAFNLRIWLFKKCIKDEGGGRDLAAGREAAQITANVNNVQPQTDSKNEREREREKVAMKARKLLPK